MRNLFTLILGIFFLYPAIGQSLSIKTVSFNNSLTYFPGGGISLHVEPKGVFPLHTNFSLQLLDQSGNTVVSNSLASVNDFYVPVLNGHLPESLADGTYTLKVVADTNGVTFAASDLSAPFRVQRPVTAFDPPEIGNQSGPVLKVNCYSTDNYFGYVDRANNEVSPNDLTFEILNPGSFQYTARLINHQTGAATSLPVTRAFGVVSLSIPAGLSTDYYNIEVTKTNGTVSSVNSYVFLFNTGNTSLGNLSSENVCMGSNVLFSVDTKVIGKNYPGSFYTIDYGDGTKVDTFTHARFLQDSLVWHNYMVATCKAPSQYNINGQFRVQINLFDKGIDDCNTYSKNGNGTSKFVNTSIAPMAQLGGPSFSCINKPVTFPNETIAGVYGNGTVCLTDPRVTWYIKAPSSPVYVKAPDAWSNNPNKDLNVPENMLNETGVWKIRITAQNPQGCLTISEDIREICIEPVPVPDFTMNGAKTLVGCSPYEVQIQNLTNENSCRPFKISWQVLDTNGANTIPSNYYTYVSGSDTALNPVFRFDSAGHYFIRLNVTNSCGTFSINRSVIVRGVTDVSFPDNPRYCGTNRIIDFGKDSSHIPKYNLSWSASDIYKWQISGGDYAFVNNTTDGDRYPQIQFKGYGVYTVQLTYTNSCGSRTISQEITIDEPVTVDAGAAALSACFNDPSLPLTATTTGPLTGLKWTTDGTGSFNPINNAHSIYTFSAQDKAAGRVKLSLEAFVPDSSVCTNASDSIAVTIKPQLVANDFSQTICSGEPVAYVPTGNQPAASYNWTSTVTSGSISGNTASGSGTINDVLINTGTTDATVTYVLTPVFDGCSGDAGKLVVTVHPTPVLTATPDRAAICSNDAARIQLASNLSNAVFSWTATAPAGISGYSNGSNASVIEHTLVNSGNAVDTVTYTISSFNGTCAGEVKVVKIAVYPRPGKPQVISPVNYCLNATASPLTATAGSGNTLTWYDNSSLLNGSPVAPTPSTTVAGTVNYYVTQQNAFGCVSPAAAISVITAPALTNNQIGNSQVVCAGSSAATLGQAGGSLTGGSGTYAFQWQQSTDGGASWQNIPGATSSSYAPGVMSTTTAFRRLVTSGPCTLGSNEVLITVQPALTNNTIAGNQEICEGGTPALLNGQLPSGGNGTFAYQWESSMDNANWTAITGAAGQNYQPGSLSVTTWFRRSVTSGACMVVSPSVMVTVNPKPNGRLTTASASICEYNAGSVSFQADQGVAPFQIELTITAPGGATSTLTQTVNGNGPVTIPVIAANSPTGNYTIVLNKISDSKGCERTGTLSMAALSVLPRPVLTISADTTICSGSSAVLTVSGADSYQWTPAPGLTSLTGVSVRVNPFATTTYTVTGNTAGCTTTASVTVKVNPTPAKPVVVRPVTYCLNAPATPLEATATEGNTLTWYDNSELANGTSTVPVPATSAAGLFYYYVTQTNTFGCASDTAAIPVTVNPALAGNTIGEGQTICAGSSPAALTSRENLSGGAGLYSYQWQSSVNGGSSWTDISGAVSDSYTPGALTTTTLYRRMVISGTCMSLSNEVTITVQPALTNVGISGDQTICAGSAPALLNGQSAEGGNGSYTYQWQISIDNTNWTDISSATAEDYQPQALSQSSWFRRTVASGSCSAVSAAVKVTVNPIPVMIQPADTSFTDHALVNGIAFHSDPQSNVTYNWTNSNPDIGLAASGTGNLPQFTTVNNSNPKAPVSGLITVTPVYSQNGVGCPGSPVSFTITVLPTVAINPIENVVVCTGTQVPALTPVTDASNSSGATITYNWTVSGQGISLTNGSGNEIPSYTTSNGTTADLVATITVTPVFHFGAQAIQGTPTSYTVTVKPATPAASAGPDRTLCAASDVQLQGNAPSGISGLWKQIAGAPASISNPAAANATVSGLQPGASYQFVWTLTGFSGCPSTTDTVVFTNRPELTQAQAGSDEVVCDFTGNGSVSLHGNLDAARSFESGNWSLLTKPAGATAAIGNPSGPHTSFTFNQSGVYSLEWSIGNDGGCTATRDTLLVKVYDRPVAGSLSGNDRLCAGMDAVLTLNNYTGQVQKWQYRILSGAGSQWRDTSVTAAAITFQAVTDTFAVRAIVQSLGVADGCTSTDTTQAYLINVAPPSAPGITSGADTVCMGSNSGSIVLTGNVGSIVRWEYSDNRGVSWTPVNYTTNTLTYENLTATRLYRAVVNSGGCGEVVSNATEIIVREPVTRANAGTDGEFCNVPQVSLQANIPAPGETGTWRQVSGNAVNFSATNQPDAQVTGLQPGAYAFEWTLSNGVCPSTKDTVLITVHPPLENIIDTVAKTICYGQAVLINGQQPTGGNGTYQYYWRMSVDSINWVDVPNQTGAFINFIPVQSVYLKRGVVSLPCSVESQPVHITVQPPVTNNTISSDQRICVGTVPATLGGSLPQGASGSYQYQWQSSTDGGQTWVNIPGANGQDFSPAALMGTTQYRRNVSSDLCNGPQSNTSNVVTITVNPDAKAVFAPVTDTACAPFDIDAAVVRLQPFIDRNSTYEWYVNDTLIGSGSSFPGYRIAQSGDSVTIKLKAISLYGCRPDSMEHRFYTRIAPMPSFTLSDTIGCGPLTVLPTNTSGFADQFNYVWDFGNGQASAQANPGPIVFLPNPTYGDTTYTIKLTAASVCSQVSFSKTVTVKSKPKALFAPSISTGCSPMKVVFNNTSLGIGNSYRWDFGDGSVATTATADTISHVFYSGTRDTFYVKLTATNECGSDTLRYAIVVAPNRIKLDFAINGNEQSGCTPHTVRFINNSQGATSFRWNFGDGNFLSTTRNIDTVTHTFERPGTYNVVLFATNGCSDTTSIEQVVVYPAPRAAFDASGLTACLGDTLRFTNRSDSATTFQWLFGDGSTANTVNAAHRFTVPGNYTVTLLATRINTPGSACSDTAKVPVSIVSSIQGWFDASDTVSSCAPFAVTFTNRNTPATTVSWDFGDGQTGTGNVVSHTFAKPGTYVVKQTATSPGGCTYLTTRTIRVMGPDGSLTYVGGVLCNDNAARFTATTSNADSLEWNFGDGVVLRTKAQVVYHTYANAGAYLPTLTLLSKGCSYPIKGADTIYVDKVKSGYTVLPQFQCDQTTLLLNDTSHAYSGLSQLKWSLGDGTTATGSPVAHNYSITGDYKIQLIAIAKSGCSDTTAVSTIHVQVNDKPKAILLLDPTYCSSPSIPMNATLQSTDPVTLLKWVVSNGASGTGNPFLFNGSQPGTYMVKLIAGTANGCYDTATQVITVNPTPVVKAGADVTICRDNSTPLTATGAQQYSWSPLQGLSCANCANPVATPKQTTSYVVTGTNTFGCSARDTVITTVIQRFKVDVKPVDSICLGQSVQLVAKGADIYNWSPAGALSATNVSNPVATPTRNTTYQVVGADANGCFTDTAYVLIAVGRPPVFSLGPDLTLPTGTQLPLNSVVTNGPVIKWQWTPATNLSCNDCALPVATVKHDISYVGKITTAYGCTASDTLNIKAFCESVQVFVPNAFTPDGDGVNDLLMVRASGIAMVKTFRVFNRWGDVVFERSSFAPNDPHFGWDGKVRGVESAPGVYVYTAEVVCENGTSYTYKGNVTLLK